MMVDVQPPPRFWTLCRRNFLAFALNERQCKNPVRRLVPIKKFTSGTKEFHTPTHLSLSECTSRI